MDFDQLTTFVQVAKLKSFSKAGQKVFRSQSAVSAQIRQLEQAYKAKLLDRSAKSVELTPAGVVLFEFAERLLRLRDESMQSRCRSRQRGAGACDLRRQRSHLPLPLARYPCRISTPLSARAHQHLPQFQSQNPAAPGRRLAGPRHRHPAVKSPNLKMHVINRDRLRFMVSTKNPLAQTQPCHPRRSRLRAADFSQDRIHAPGSRQTLPAVPLAAASCDGTSQHRHDQNISSPPTSASPSSAKASRATR